MILFLMVLLFLGYIFSKGTEEAVYFVGLVICWILNDIKEKICGNTTLGQNR